MADISGKKPEGLKHDASLSRDHGRGDVIHLLSCAADGRLTDFKLQNHHKIRFFPEWRLKLIKPTSHMCIKDLLGRSWNLYKLDVNRWQKRKKNDVSNFLRGNGNKRPLLNREISAESHRSCNYDNLTAPSSFNKRGTLYWSVGVVHYKRRTLWIKK